MSLQKMAAVVAGLAMLASVPVQAQALHDYGASAGGSAITERGVAVRASVRIALGASNPRQSEERVTLNIASGPSYRIGSVQPGVNSRIINGDAVRLSLGFDHGTTLRMNGVRVARLSGPLTAAESEEEKSGGISGWAIAGGVLAAGLGAAYLALEDAIDCTEDGEYICE